ncbi:MAG: hypothetical protein PQJ50_00705, partial [Spirochaetales bacterium]|nr:hypothetical protein [Spirochaetales bacterium]
LYLSWGDEDYSLHLSDLGDRALNLIESPGIRFLYHAKEPELYNDHSQRLIDHNLSETLLAETLSDMVRLNKAHHNDLFQIIRINYLIFSSIIFILTIYLGIKEINRYKKRIKEEADRENNRKLSHYLEYERNFIAMELHDGAAQKMAALSRYLQKREWDEEHNVMSRYCSDVILNIRSISHFLRSPDFVSFSLKQQLIILFGDFRQTTDINLETRFFGIDAMHLKDERNLHIFRVVQELLINGYKHSGADTISLDFIYSYPFLKICYRDNGTGKVHNPDISGMGSRGLNYRLNLLKGSMKESNNKGYWVSIIIPLEDLEDSP